MVYGTLLFSSDVNHQDDFFFEEKKKFVAPNFHLIHKSIQ